MCDKGQLYFRDCRDFVQMDRASKAVETNNAKLAGVLMRVASTRNFCIDITLIMILLAVVGYIYTLVN